MSITIAITGQALIHEPLQPPHDGEVDAVRAFLKADAVIGNFEGVVEAPGAWPTKTKTVHSARPEAVASLAALGFTAMAHANNHAFDLGPPGIAATHAAMGRHGILVAGSGLTLEEAVAPVEWTVGSQKLAFLSVDLGPQSDIVYASAERAGVAPLRVHRSTALPEADYERLLSIHEQSGDADRLSARRRVGYSPQAKEGFSAFGGVFVPGTSVEARWTVDRADLEALVTSINGVKQKGCIVLLALHNHHWDADWTAPPGWYDDLTRSLVDAGADVIIGTGAPVLQPLQVYRDRAVLPGLGNFIFHTARADVYDAAQPDVWKSVIVRLTLGNDGHLQQVDCLPIRVCRLGAICEAPVLLQGAEREAVRSGFMAAVLQPTALSG